MEGSEHVPQQVGTGLGEVFFEEAGRVDTGCDGHRRGSFRDGFSGSLEGSRGDRRQLRRHAHRDPIHHVKGRNHPSSSATRLLQPAVFSSVSESVWEKGLPYTCKSVFCSYFSVFPDSVKVTLNASVRSVLSMNWVSATPLLWVLSVIVVPGAPSATTQTPRGMQNVS